ncbi:MAG: putative zinc-binding metallopeptidase [Candidatus Peribacteria bacterium]|nr:putative zinc-binding metallopeptidase [Candidatus Peribacteria bacterium]
MSWKETKILKSSLTQKDFVSGYAMTNKYEDFAETFTYYVLHNSDFLEKSKNSSILKQKYDYFRSHIFSKNEFIDSLLK